MMTWYAWSPIDHGVKRDETDKTLILGRDIIPLGDEVSASTLDIDEDSDEWMELVRSGAVREYEFPEELQDPNTSAQKIVSARLVALEEGVDTGNLDSALVADLMKPEHVWTEGEHEVSPEGTVSPASEPPPKATATSNQ
jgi:hypothetical protein